MQFGIFQLCDSLWRHRNHTLTNEGYITTALYPLPVHGPANCSTVFMAPTGCRLLRLTFLDFFMAPSNYLIIESIPYSGYLTGFSALIDMLSDHVTMSVQLMNATQISTQRVAFIYKCC